MLVLALVVIGILVGSAAAAAVLRWPSRDLSAPRLTASGIEDKVYRHPRLRAHLRSRVDPATATGLALTSVIVVLAVAATVVGVLAAMARSQRGLAGYDETFNSWIDARVTTTSTSAMRFVTQFGGALVIVPLTVLVALVETRRLRSRSVPLFLLIVVGGQFGLANLIKFVVDRARPALDPLTGFSGASFPSGHATAAAATYASFALLAGIRRSRSTRAVGAGLAAAVAVVIAGSRVLLGVHWLTDVIAGLILGWAWFAACSFAFGGRFLRFGVPVEQAEQIAVAAPAPNPSPTATAEVADDAATAAISRHGV